MNTELIWSVNDHKVDCNYSNTIAFFLDFFCVVDFVG